MSFAPAKNVSRKSTAVPVNACVKEMAPLPARPFCVSTQKAVGINGLHQKYYSHGFAFSAIIDEKWHSIGSPTVMKDLHSVVSGVFPLKIPASIYRFAIDANGKMSFEYMSAGLRHLIVDNDWSARVDAELLMRLVIADDRPAFMQSIMHSFETLAEWNHEFSMVARDGSFHRLLGKSTPVKRENGTVAWDGVLIDITAQYETARTAAELQNRLQKIESQVPGVIYQFQMFRDGRTALPYASSNTKQYLNVDRADVTANGAAIFANIHPDDAPRIQQAIADSFANLSPWLGHFRVCFNDGTVKHIAANSIPELQADGSVLWTGFLTDMTPEILAQEKIEEGQAYFQNMFREHSAPMLIVDPEDGNIFDANEAAANFYGYTVAELRRMHIEDINMLPPDEIKRRLLKATEKRHREFTMPHRLKNGEIRMIETRTAPVTFGSRKMLSSIITDVTEKLAAEQLLMEQKQQLERSNADLENFAYVASHDLKEPLRMINSFIGLIEKRIGHTLDDKNRQFFWFVKDAATRMRKMIDELLKYSQVGRKNCGFQLTDINEVLQYNLRLFHRAIHDGNVQVTIAPLPNIQCNQPLMQELFHNLLSNALKFTTGHQPVINIGYDENDIEFRFYVCDNGIGIKPQYAKEVFNMFRRLHAATEYEGAGIGLALCKRIVDYHQGQIWVESEPGKGSCFWFTIPKNHTMGRLETVEENYAEALPVDFVL